MRACEYVNIRWSGAWEIKFVTTFNYIYEEECIQKIRLSAMTSFDEWPNGNEFFIFSLFVDIWPQGLNICAGIRPNFVFGKLNTTHTQTIGKIAFNLLPEAGNGDEMDVDGNVVGLLC